jgi:phenylalanine-4-hydroxylase
MIQDYNTYSDEDHGTWKILFERQYDNLVGKSCPQFLQCLDLFVPELEESQVPRLDLVSQRLSEDTGWSIEVVKGLIPVEDFFTLLSERSFCSSTWLRSRKDLDYLEEPDMFHDTFGHIPLLLDSTYAAFMERFGKVGVQNIDDGGVLTALQRLYWFTVEFGLMSSGDNSTIYGAGILSSYGESNHIFNDDIEVLPFDLNSIIHNDFVNSEIQNRYYAINDFQQLYDSLDELEKMIQNGIGIEEKIVR